MRITIVDLDWLNKVSFVPNVKCMKLSSYHQQLGDLVSFPQSELELLLDYDKMYVVRDKMSGKMPKQIPIRDEKVYLIGDYFGRFYSRYAGDLYNEVVAACRPDYLLYPIKEENKLTKANIAQFYHNGKRLERIQDFKNAYLKSHYTLVVDENFWSYSIDDIKACVEVLKPIKNIVFEKEISLKQIVFNPEVKELFLSLKLQESSLIKFVNDCEEKDYFEILKFLKEFKTEHPTYQFPIIYFKALSLDHNEDHHLAIVDFERCMRLIYEAKKMGVRIYIQAPPRKDTPFWYFFEELECWCKYRYKQSFIEHMFFVSTLIYKRPMNVIILNKIMWNTVQSQMFEDLYRRYPDIINKYGYLKWEDDYYPPVNFEKIINRREQ